MVNKPMLRVAGLSRSFGPKDEAMKEIDTGWRQRCHLFTR